MPTPGSSSIYVNQDTGIRLRELAKRESRDIIVVLNRMLDLYIPLTLADHVIIAQVTTENGLQHSGDALRIIIEDCRRLQIDCAAYERRLAFQSATEG